VYEVTPLGSAPYTRIPTHSFRLWTKRTAPRSRQHTGTLGFLRRARCALPLVALVCSFSGRPTRFSPFSDRTLSRGTHPGALLPLRSPGQHNIFGVFLIDPQLRGLLVCSRLKVRSYVQKVCSCKPINKRRGRQGAGGPVATPIRAPCSPTSSTTHPCPVPEGDSLCEVRNREASAPFMAGWGKKKGLHLLLGRRSADPLSAPCAAGRDVTPRRHHTVTGISEEER
jgi:hypothetical protein